MITRVPGFLKFKYTYLISHTHTHASPKKVRFMLNLSIFNEFRNSLQETRKTEIVRPPLMRIRTYFDIFTSRPAASILIWFYKIVKICYSAKNWYFFLQVPK